MVLEVEDVLAMLQPSFWQTDALTAFRYCALVALLACCHILPGHARGIKLENWRFKGRNVVRIWRHHEWQIVHLTPQAVFAVERFLQERNRLAKERGWKNSEFLFLTRNGTRPHYNFMAHGFKALRKRIGSESTIARLLKNFCVRKLRNGNDEVASRRYRGLGKPHADKHTFLPPVDDAKLARLVSRCNPFKKLDRQVRDEDAAKRWLKGKNFVVRTAMTEKTRTMPTDHPLVAELSKIVWPRGRRACRVLRSQLWEMRGDEIDRLLRERLLTAELVARLLHCKRGAVQSFIHFHYRVAKERPFQRYRERKVKAKPTEADRATVAALGAAPLPSDPEDRTRAAIDRATEYLPVLEGMLSRRVLAKTEAAKLLGIRVLELDLLRGAAKEGISPERILGHRRVFRVPTVWWDKIRDAHAKRPEADTNKAFFCRMVTAGFPGAFQTFAMFCVKNFGNSASVMSEQEQAKMAALSALVWSPDPQIRRAQRADAMRWYLLDIVALVDANKLGIGKAASFFKCHSRRLNYFRKGLEAGLSLEELLAPPMPVPNAVWTKIRCEHELAPDEPDQAFYFRMRLAYGYAGGEKRIRTFRQILRYSHLAPAPGAVAEVRV